ncbi:hypothetical protein ABW19_dt0205069 [Dactylella cylindrospora]|nr:hypothetical protein ABW19_dt0205069 [Dactylella cylindrospora]
MSEKDIEDRLRNHAKSFDSLLNLIPAKLYYTQDNSDQWKKRKQTREESKAAKRAKLDPDQPVTVKEVEDERARQREAKEEKRRKLNEDGTPYETKSQTKARKKEEKRRQRRERKMVNGGEHEDEKEDSPELSAGPSVADLHHPAKRKGGKVKEVQLKVNGTQKSGKAVAQNSRSDSEGSDQPSSEEEEDANQSESDSEDNDGNSEDGVPEKPLPVKPVVKSTKESTTKATQPNGKLPSAKPSKPVKKLSKPEPKEDEDDISSVDDSDDGEDSIQRINGLAGAGENVNGSPSPAPSNNTDTSSTAQKSLAEKLKSSKDPAVQQQLRERLAKRIEALRQARKADGGETPRTRTELMDQRRKRDELRKERKKQMRLQAKAEAVKTNPHGDEAQEGRSSNTGSKSISNGTTALPANYSFGEVHFGDGDKLKASLDGVKALKKKKGPTDVLGAIKHMEAAKARLESMPDDKRTEIQEKNRWSKALKMASGEKLQDDETLLKKSLKRQEKAKKKSEREWKERNANVEKAKALRQKKREANIAARKEQKKSGKSGKKGRKVPSKKSKGRAGFEGAGFGGAGKKKKAGRA